jgi:predicted nucleic acid-binding protein
MTVDETLTDVKKLGFDSSPFIYFVERHPTYIEVTREFYRRVDNGSLGGFTSVITLTEVLTQPKRKENLKLELEYLELLLSSRNLSVHSVDVPIANRAADLRARWRIRRPDALQIATSLNAGCDAFLTNDKELKRVQEIRVLVLDEITL